MADDLRYIRAEIVRWVSDDNPGIVEARFKDAYGKEWAVVEKAPVLSAGNLWSDSVFPQPGFIACTILASHSDGIFEISTAKPWAIASLTGEAVFKVFERQLTDKADW